MRVLSRKQLTSSSALFLNHLGTEVTGNFVDQEMDFSCLPIGRLFCSREKYITRNRRSIPTRAMSRYLEGRCTDELRSLGSVDCILNCGYNTQPWEPREVS